MNCDYEHFADSKNDRGEFKNVCRRCGRVIWNIYHPSTWRGEPHDCRAVFAKPWEVAEWGWSLLDAVVGEKATDALKSKPAPPPPKDGGLTEDELAELRRTDPTLIGNRLESLFKAVGIPTCADCGMRRNWMNAAHEHLRRASAIATPRID